MAEGERKNSTVRIYPGTQATDAEIKTWEKDHGYTLPTDYACYLTSVGACKLHGTVPEHDHDYSLKLYSLKQLGTFSELALGNEFKGVPRSWYAIADANDGNYTIMDLNRASDQHTDIIDGFSENSGHGLFLISQSFSEFLGRAMADPHVSSGGGSLKLGTRFWSKPGGYYGEVKCDLE